MGQKLLINAMAAIKSMRSRFRVARYVFGLIAVALVGIAAITRASAPPGGLDPRTSIGAYMNGMLPTLTSQSMPATLSQTGVMTSTPLRTPHPGFVPYELNSPLWTDGADKSRAIAIPYSSADPNDPIASPRIGFAPTGSWTFPNGTVIIKNFDMKIDERVGAAYPVRRLETRILIRNADGTIRGATYRWAEPTGGSYSDAALISDRFDEPLTITQADGSKRTQTYTYPGPSDCVRCHNDNAGMVLGIRTSQLNGNFTYPSTGRTDNQLHAWDLVGMLNTPLADPSTYPRSVDITDTSATLEHRVRSYLASNCSHCHQPNGEGPWYDMRFEASALDSLIISHPFRPGLIRDDLLNSLLYVRDSALPNSFPSPMPPIARNVPDQRVLNVYDQWVNYDYDVMSATRLSPTQVRVQFNRAVEAASATATSNYALDNGAVVTQVTADADPAAVILTTSTLAVSTPYTVTINRVKEAQLPQNPIWPNTTASFTTPGPTVPDAPTLTGIQAGDRTATLTFSLPGSNGGAAITSYSGSCTSTSPAAMITANRADFAPIVVTGLTNGVQYNCSVRVSNSAGQSSPSNTLAVTPVARVPILVAAFSRKTHGAGVDFDLPLKTNVDITGAVSVEPRGGTHTIVFQFDAAIGAPGSVTTSSGTATAMVSPLNSDEVIVTLSSIVDGQRMTVSLTDVNGAGAAATATVSLGFLIGDVNGTRAIDQIDVSAIKARAGQPTSASNFWFDLNLSGSITASEVAAVKARNGRTLT